MRPCTIGCIPVLGCVTILGCIPVLGCASIYPLHSLLAQGWLDLPKEDDTSLATTGMLSEKWVRHWFVLRNTVLNMYTEEQKEQARSYSLLVGSA